MITGSPDGPANRYSAEAWEQTAAEARASQSTRSAAVDRGPAHTTLAPGIVAMSLRGDAEDVERLLAKMRREGIAVWRVPDNVPMPGRSADYQYFTVEVPREAGHG